MTVKETSPSDVDGRRRWHIMLDKPRDGEIRLAADFTQPLTETSAATMTLPAPRAVDVAYQSGLMTVEGASELELQVSEHPRPVDVVFLVHEVARALDPLGSEA